MPYRRTHLPNEKPDLSTCHAGVTLKAPPTSFGFTSPRPHFPPSLPDQTQPCHGCTGGAVRDRPSGRACRVKGGAPAPGSSRKLPHLTPSEMQTRWKDKNRPPNAGRAAHREPVHGQVPVGRQSDSRCNDEKTRASTRLGEARKHRRKGSNRETKNPGNPMRNSACQTHPLERISLGRPTT